LVDLRKEEAAMPDQDQSKPPPGETKRSFTPGDDDGYRADTFSRNDEEGVPADDSGEPDTVADAEPILAAGEAGGYQTDAFSRGDEEGVPVEELRGSSPKATPAEAAPEGAHRKALDDADSRDAPPMAPREGGVR
jgi:hypothetical protein